MQGARSEVWLFQMSDEQRRMAAFATQPCGTGLKWLGTTLHLAGVRLAHVARRALFRAISATVAATPIV